MLQHYIRLFQKLKIGRSKGLPAPHKPLLLLAIIQLIDDGIITENEIKISAELVAKFKDLFSLLAPKDSVPNFALPFFHLRTSGFWHLKTHSGQEIALTSSRSISSFGQLRQEVSYAYLDSNLWKLLVKKESREILKHALFQQYFPNRSESTVYRQQDLFSEVANQILEESPELYAAQVAVADEEELFVRGGVFKRIVPKVYNFTCCISGMRLITPRQLQMVDACHIIPFSESRDDTITNGISLCPNLHRAFDRFLISIDESFRVHVAADILEQGPFSIAQFAGKMIQMPAEMKYRPSIDNLSWHWAKFTSTN